MVKFHEAEIRKFRSVFVCRKCKTKLRAPNTKVTQGKVTCSKCGGRALRTVRRK